MRVLDHHVFGSICLLLVVVVQQVRALPTGAAGCEGAIPAVMGPHLDNDPITGELQDGGFVARLNGTVLTSDGVFPVAPGEYTLSVSGASFRGILIRFEGTTIDMSDLVSPQTSNVQPATACFGSVGGVTHWNNIDKTEAEASLTVPQGVQDFVFIDITVVVQLTPTSQYYYSPYLIQFLQEQATPTTQPSSEVTASPSTLLPTGTSPPALVCAYALTVDASRISHLKFDKQKQTVEMMCQQRPLL